MELITVRSGSSGNCYFLHDDNGHYLMLDCGERVKWNEEILVGCNHEIAMVDAMLCTHIHRDHLPKVKLLQNNGIPVYSSDEVHTFVRETQGELIKAMPEKSIQFLSGGWKCVPWYVPHTDVESGGVKCFAYYIESPTKYRAVYITDFLYSPVVFKPLKPQLILVACNHDDELDGEEDPAKVKHIVTGHSSLSTVKRLIKANMTDELRNVVLCHLSSRNATPSVMLKEIQEVVGDSVTVSIANNGEKINLTRKDAQ